MSLPTTKCPSKRVGDLQPNNLVLFDVDEQLGEPRGIFAKVEATDQGGTVGVASREYVEQLSGSTYAESGNVTPGAGPPPTEHARTALEIAGRVIDCLAVCVRGRAS